ncbi:Response regulator receiver (modular protein) [Desulfamplus magnetovallimortis]|uniref:Response regulator receiver (Modular protein) n=1 Tax=Desulfamplus magnetovallimortis TaxID=1246637 RepID=A0A1W1HI74_9BACT|nr:response regulator [Desulfamplus magnetovallimortis]SLM32082.1 Response regulator receiver (modular protein) [Desulfamplus magnetovallimortis]
MANSGKPRILIVDDEIHIQEMLSRNFRFEGYDVMTAGNGQEALDILAEHRIEVVISDINMPIMNGIELLKTIRKEYQMVQVIIITGYVTMTHLLDALRHGAHTCIFKPMDDLKELEEAVKRCIGHLKHWQKKLIELQSIKPEDSASEQNIITDFMKQP